jgi:hypothetical protein
LRIVISSVIAGVLLLQAFWVIPEHLRRRVLQKVGGRALVETFRAPVTYPFLDYPMYRRSRAPGEPIEQLRLFALRRDGSEEELHPEGLGMTFWHFGYMLRAVLRADVASVRDCLETLDPGASRGIAALRIENEPILWADGQVRTGERIVMATLQLADATSPP